MDIREIIVQSIIEKLTGRVEQEVTDIIQDVLIIELNQYEVQERCTDVAVVDGSAEAILKKFIATKRLEVITVLAKSIYTIFERRCSFV